MMPWIRTTPVGFAGLARAPACALPGEPTLAEIAPRAAAARALAQAAERRRRAEREGPDRDYWRALAPQALAHARNLRRDQPRLP